MTNFKNSISKLEDFFSKKYFAGAVMVVSHEKKVIFSKALGYNDLETKSEMSENLLFRAYSMTKPITVAAFLILVQKKLISVDSFLEDIYPEFKMTKVLVDENSNDLENQKSKITMKHLLTMSAGFTYHGNKNLTQKKLTSFLREYVSLHEGKFWNYDDFCANLSEIPLAFQPGEQWFYSIGLDVLSAVIEKVSQKKFYEFVTEEIFKPLNMFDSKFYVWDKEREACVYNAIYEDDGYNLQKINGFSFLFQKVYEETPIAMGGAGLVTTAKDYNKFLNFLLDGKDENGNQILDFDLIKEMRTNQISDIQESFKWTLNEDYGYGYGVRVRLSNDHFPKTNIGEFGWDGLLGSTGLVDPQNQITMNVMLSSKPGNNKLVESEFFDAFYSDLENLKIVKR
ncbi:hypothetical protein SHELI_v1c01050 [Spiroplasma helicoides]|uniref:Beta-lactamase-related domain-containing protein n=1 Tax=Spiroplasma helicoides TaxID=216938 RepID=A0A1B3SJG6_9MOLU|nr:serine hydrolase domain-containing protein [Spiroplasma helicoides]AOG60060.1 hypothetical protein SHELI_v1c01050 [Spiroplasma helicoides]